MCLAYPVHPWSYQSLFLASAVTRASLHTLESAGPPRLRWIVPAAPGKSFSIWSPYLGWHLTTLLMEAVMPRGRKASGRQEQADRRARAPCKHAHVNIAGSTLRYSSVLSGEHWEETSCSSLEKYRFFWRCSLMAWQRPQSLRRCADWFLGRVRGSAWLLGIFLALSQSQTGSDHRPHLWN